MNPRVALILLAGLFALKQPLVRADIIERQFTQPGGSGVTSGVVFQGSREMRHLGKSKRGTVSSIVVPSLNPVTVIPALENETLRPRPRFGYGSDYVPESRASMATAPSAPLRRTIQGPVYQLQYTYPVYRDYWMTSPYVRYFSPYGGFSPSYGCHSHSRSSVFLSFGW